jgi:hypothetical protein
MFRLAEKIVSKVLPENEEKSCIAMTKDGLCDREMYGRGCVDGEEIRYCKRHVPSKAMIAGGRVNPVEFKVPDGKIEVR